MYAASHLLYSGMLIIEIGSLDLKLTTIKNPKNPKKNPKKIDSIPSRFVANFFSEFQFPRNFFVNLNFRKNFRELRKTFCEFSISKISDLHFPSPDYWIGKDSHYRNAKDPFRSNIPDSENVIQMDWKSKIQGKNFPIPKYFFGN